MFAVIMAIGCELPARAAGPLDEDIPSEITIYGRLNATYERIRVTDAQPIWNVVDNSSRLGFRGRTNLGGGLSAFFQIESRIRLDVGETGWASRPSYVGLQGALGSGRVGRTTGPVYRATYEYISLHNHNSGTSGDAFIAGTVYGHQIVMNNTVWYTSPKLGPASIAIAYSLLGEVPLAGMPRPRHVGLVGSYDQGAFHLAVSRADTKNTSDLGFGMPNHDVATTLGGLYAMRFLVVGALFERADSKLIADEIKRNYFRLSAMVPVAMHEFHLNLGRVNHRLDVKSSDDGAMQRTLAYGYNFDKDTKVYAFYTVVDNQKNGNYGFSTKIPGVDNRSLAMGMRYNF